MRSRDFILLLGKSGFLYSKNLIDLDPAIYNLLKDPPEQECLRHYIEDTWVETPLYKVLDDHLVSLKIRAHRIPRHQEKSNLRRPE